jgi:hypothetical protein
LIATPTPANVQKKNPKRKRLGFLIFGGGGGDRMNRLNDFKDNVFIVFINVVTDKVTVTLLT